MSDLISVIVPVYKVEKYLDKCVQSIVDQTYTNLEIILVDDGSPDNCPQMCDEWAKKDSRIKVIHKENGGVSSARNIALDNLSGDWVVFVDSDDFLLQGSFAHLVNIAKENNVEIIESSMSVLEFNGNVNRYVRKKELISREIRVKQGLIDSGLSVWCKFFSSKILKDIRFDEKISNKEDMLFYIQALLKCNKIYSDDFVVYTYVQHEGERGSAPTPSKTLDYLVAIEKIETLLGDEYNKEKFIFRVTANYNMASRLIIYKKYKREYKQSKKFLFDNFNKIFNKENCVPKRVKKRIFLLIACPFVFKYRNLL